jgi:arylsulfatase A-like enzyme
MGIGRILDTLRKHQIEENTILVVTTDHGIPFPRAKATLYDSGIGVFLFMRYPRGGWPAGCTRRELVSHVDLLPTLLEACAIPPLPNLQGRSVLGLLRGDGQPRCDAIFAEKTFFSVYDPMRCIRTSQYKYIRNFEFSRHIEISVDAIHGGAHRELENRYAGVHVHPAEELYDLAKDPDELVNLAGDHGYQDQRRVLCKALAEWMTETDDPLLRVPVASPFYYRQLEQMGLPVGQSVAQRRGKPRA